MHTFEGNSCLIHYNSDMSGDCIIVNKKSGEEISVSCKDIVNFSGEYFKSKLIERIEGMKLEDLSGLSTDITDTW